MQWIEKNYKVIASLILALSLAAGTALAIHAGPVLRYADEANYRQIAINLLHCHMYSYDCVSSWAWRPPGYVWFLALGEALHGSATTLRIFNVTSLAACQLFAYLLARRIGSRAMATLAMLLSLAYPVILYTAALLFPQTFGSALFLCGLWLLLGPQSITRARALGAGIVWGLLVLTIPTFVIVLVFFTCWLFVTRPQFRRKLPIFVVTVALVLGSWSARNYRVFHTFVFVATNGGVNLLMGNSEYATATTGSGVNIEKYVAVGHTLPEVESDRYYSRSAKLWIKTHPSQALHLYFAKLVHYFGFVDTLVADDATTSLSASSSRQLITMLTYGPLLLLFIARLALFRRMPLSSEELCLVAIFFLNAFFSSIFFTRIRLRLPFDWLMLIIDAGLIDRLATGSWRVRPLPRRAVQTAAAFVLTGALTAVLLAPHSAAAQPTAQAPSQHHACEVNDWDLDVEACYPQQHNAGEKIISCLEDVDAGKYPVGTVCDARGIIKEGAMLFGDAPIEIGKRVHEELLLPSSGIGLLQTSARFFPTPAAPHVSAVPGEGYLPGTYYFRVNFRTGDAVSASSPEVTTSASAASGRFAVTLPSCPEYATSVDITASNAAGHETLQGNGLCGRTVTLGNPGHMYSGISPAPEKATALPAILLHNETKSAIYSEDGAQGGYFLEPEGHTFAGSNMLAVTGNGYSMMKNLAFYNNSGARSIISNVYDVGCYASCVRDHLFSSAGDNSVAYKLLGQYNDVKILDPNFVCAGKNNVTPFEILATPGNATGEGMDTESIHSLNIIGGLIGCVGPGNTGPAVVVAGRSSAGLPKGTALPTGISNVNFWGTTFELGHQQIGVEVRDVSNVNFLSIFSTNAPHSPAARFLQIDSTGTYGAGFPTTSQIHISSGSSIAWPTIVVNSIDEEKVAGNLTNAYTKSYDFGGGDDLHANFADMVEGEAQSRDAASPIATRSSITEAPATLATAHVKPAFTGSATAGSNIVTVSGAAPSDLAREDGLAASQPGIFPAGTTVTATEGARITLSHPALRSGSQLSFTPFSAKNSGSQSYFAIQASTIAAAENSTPQPDTTEWRIAALPNSASRPDAGTTLTLSPILEQLAKGKPDAGPQNWEIKGLNDASVGALFAGADVGLYPVGHSDRAGHFDKVTAAPSLTFYNSAHNNGYDPGCSLTPAVAFEGTTGQTLGTLGIGGAQCQNVHFTAPVEAVEVASGTSTNSDLNGELTLKGGSASYNFHGHYTTPPVCIANDTIAAAPVRVQATRTSLTLTGTGADVITYICMGRN
jgi:hypothetical protein